MSPTIVAKPMPAWSKGELSELRALARAVYPHREAENWPGRAITWAAPDWGVGVLGEDGSLLSFAGLVIREAQHEQTPVRIGGIGGVKTHPDHRGNGYAAMATRRGHELFAEEGAHFGLLVCEDDLIPYYQRLRWEVFTGDLITRQPSGEVLSEFNRVIVLPITTPAPRGGVIDLNGPPW